MVKLSTEYDLAMKFLVHHHTNLKNHYPDHELLRFGEVIDGVFYYYESRFPDAVKRFAKDGKKPEKVEDPETGKCHGITLKTVVFKKISSPNRIRAGIRK